MLSTASFNTSSNWTGNGSRGAAGSGDKSARRQRKPGRIKWSQRVVREHDDSSNHSSDHPARSKSIQVNQSTQCNQFIVNYQTLDYKLRCVADCLVHLNTEHTEANNNDDDDDDDNDDNQQQQQSRRHNDSTMSRCNYPPNQLSVNHQQPPPAAQCLRDGSRIKKTVGIYRILLRLLPLEAHLELDSTTTNGPGNELAKLFRQRHFNPLEARQQVLDLIECQLNGYCDSIDRLRCILRSDTMIGVMGAFEAIVKNIITHNDGRLREDLLRNQSAVDRGKFEFRIVQEWRV